MFSYPVCGLLLHCHLLPFSFWYTAVHMHTLGGPQAPASTYRGAHSRAGTGNACFTPRLQSCTDTPDSKRRAVVSANHTLSYGPVILGRSVIPGGSVLLGRSITARCNRLDTAGADGTVELLTDFLHNRVISDGGSRLLKLRLLRLLFRLRRCTTGQFFWHVDF